MTMHVTEVSGCTVDNCAFNHEHECNAYAITVAGGQDHASCGTFIDTSSLGACQRNECIHNDHLMCNAHDVRVGPGADAADCLTYEHR